MTKPAKVHKVRFTKSGKTIDVAETDLLLAEAVKAGLTLPFYCRRGACRSCRQVVRGKIDTHGKTLTEKEKADGWALLCVSHPLEDLTVEA